MNVPEIPAAARRAIADGVRRDDPVAEMEFLGLSPRVISLLEESRYEIISLSDLLGRTQTELLAIPSFGDRTLSQILACLARYDCLPAAKQKLEKSMCPDQPPKTAHRVATPPPWMPPRISIVTYEVDELPPT